MNDLEWILLTAAYDWYKEGTNSFLIQRETSVDAALIFLQDKGLVSFADSDKFPRNVAVTITEAGINYMRLHLL